MFQAPAKKICYLKHGNSRVRRTLCPMIDIVYTHGQILLGVLHYGTTHESSLDFVWHLSGESLGALALGLILFLVIRPDFCPITSAALSQLEGPG